MTLPYISNTFNLSHRELLAPQGKYLEEGDTIYRRNYSKTLRAIGESGNASYFYHGPFMEQMVRELQGAGAPIQEEDFLNYAAIEREPVETTYDGLKVIGAPPPASGAVLALILNILQGTTQQKRICCFNNEICYIECTITRIRIYWLIILETGL